MKKDIFIEKVLAVILWMVVIVSCFFPLREMRDMAEPAFVVAWRTVDLWSLSPVASLAFLLPFLWIALLICHLPQSTKLMLFFVFTTLGCVAFSTAMCDIELWAETYNYSLICDFELGFALYASASMGAVITTFPVLNRQNECDDSAKESDSSHENNI